MSELHFAGYHGTSADNARSIEQDGFRDSGVPICFAPIDDLHFAMSHGRRRAEEFDDSQYGVVLATFPPQELKLGLRGYQIEVPREGIGRIVIRKVMIFEALPSGLQVPRSALGENS
jgi:hypothetical protein